MILKKIRLLRKKFSKFNIDGYIVPKNDEYFSEYSKQDRLKIISNFSGSAGYAVILKKKNYLFVDGRYQIQAEMQSGNNFKITKYQRIVNCDLFKGLTLGIDTKLFTSNQINNYFGKFNKIKKIDINLIDLISRKKPISNLPFYSLPDTVVGESYKSKLNKIRNYLKKNNSDYLFITAPENISWLFNIRGKDNPNSPITNCHLLIEKSKKFYFFCRKKKFLNLIKEKKVKTNQVLDPSKFKELINNLRNRKIIIDNKTCSIFFEDILKSKFRIIKKKDPIYYLKSIKNPTEIQNMIQSHIQDGIALTKFLYWIKNKNKKIITEFEAQNKLEKFRKNNKTYLSPSFDTIAGSGPNGAIVHYRATKSKCRKIGKDDIFLCDSGGQYKYGTTDVTRTICFSKPKPNIKKIFTLVLKGHIAVATSNLDTHNCGKLIDIKARKFLKKYNLDYDHGTGHGVGFFLNVHEGPQGISKFNNIKFKEGMILSNEPGYYKKNSFGIRIENLVYVRKVKNKLFFENLTLAPIDKDLINLKLLTDNEKNYLFKYNLLVYSKLSKYLKNDERRWLLSLI
mgnify:CR=1 FL=1|tara:strand:- start:18815 stop:20512 length:1698 start_codon:yes stop_codon:yes gene_type:complete